MRNLFRIGNRFLYKSFSAYMLSSHLDKEVLENAFSVDLIIEMQLCSFRSQSFKRALDMQ